MTISLFERSACEEQVDILYLVDGTLSNTELVEVKVLLSDLIDSAAEGDRIAIGAYARRYVQLTLGFESDKSSAMAAVSSLQSFGGVEKDTANALNSTFPLFELARQDALQVIVVLTGTAMHTTDVEELESTARTVRDQGILILGVGLGDLDENDELLLAAGDGRMVLQDIAFENLAMLSMAMTAFIQNRICGTLCPRTK